MSRSDRSTADPASDDADVPESLARLACLRVTHDSACSLDAVTPDEPVEAARTVADADRVTECVVLATCNRVEVYAAVRTPDAVDAALDAATRALDDPADATTETGLDAVEHLFRVAAGLDSVVVGEDHVLGQVRRALDRSEAAGLAGGALSRVARAAIRTGRESRDATAVNDGEVSYASAGCNAIEAFLDGAPSRVAVVGAGEMAGAAVTAVRNRWSVRVDVVNRSPAPARELASPDGEYRPLDELEDALVGVDAVLTATGSADPVLWPDHLPSPDLPVVDLAMPSDVHPDVTAHPDARVVGLDELGDRVQSHLSRRRAAVPQVEDRIEAAVRRLVRRERENRAEDALRAIHRQAATHRDRELERARNRLDDGDADPETVLEEFASALVGRVLADPTAALREAARRGDDDMVAAAGRLFDVDGGGSK
ncbi:glutamyl-tRNA reductase [Halobacteriaceae archaeon GCM10025711]